jgi:DNA-binding HxlR family transcriptional regulator
MERKALGHTQCPIARSLGRVGDLWSIAIMRDAFYGLTRFDEFQKSLGIAPNMLTQRLNALVADGLLERRRYSEKPPRHEYILTAVGRDFRPVLLSLLAWGNRNFAPEGASVQIQDVITGDVAEPVLVDALSGRRVDQGSFRIVAGPAADERMQRRLSTYGSL